MRKWIVFAAIAWASPAAAQVNARCMIEIATVTNEQHLLTTEAGRQAADRKAREIRSQAMNHMTRLDAAMRGHTAEMTRQRDFLENGLITRAEYDAKAAQVPDVSPLVEIIRTYPSCEFLRYYTFSASVRRAREILGLPAREY